MTPQLDGLPAAVWLVRKNEGNKALLQAISEGLERGAEWLRRVQRGINTTNKELLKDYKDARRQSLTYSWTSFGIAVLGVSIVFLGLALAYVERLPIGTVTTLAGVVTEAVSYLLFRRADAANARMDHYHQERVEGQRFQTLLQACDGLNTAQERTRCRSRVIMTAADKWMSSPTQIPPRPGETAKDGK